MLIATAHKLDNLNLLIDYNKIQALSRIDDALPLFNLKKKLSRLIGIVKKYLMDILSCLKKLSKKHKKNNKPTAYIIHTIKGKGIKEFENDPAWHARKLTRKRNGDRKKSFKNIEIMRRKFGKIINDLAKKDKKIILLVGDIGYGIFDEYRKNHPKGFLTWEFVNKV